MHIHYFQQLPQSLFLGLIGYFLDLVDHRVDPVDHFAVPVAQVVLVGHLAVDFASCFDYVAEPVEYTVANGFGYVVGRADLADHLVDRFVDLVD